MKGLLKYKLGAAVPPTSVPNFNILPPLVTDIWRGSQNKKVGTADLLRRPLADKFLHGAIVPANAYQWTKFQLPSSDSFRYKEDVPKFNIIWEELTPGAILTKCGMKQIHVILFVDKCVQVRNTTNSSKMPKPLRATKNADMLCMIWSLRLVMGGWSVKSSISCGQWYIWLHCGCGISQ